MIEWTTGRTAPTMLQVEHLGSGVLGLGDRRPRLSWRLPHDSRQQTAYGIEIDGWDTGTIVSRDSVLVP